MNQETNEAKKLKKQMANKVYYEKLKKLRDIQPMEAGKVDIIMPEEPKKIELIKPEESLINTITTKNDELSILLDRLIEKRLKEKETLFLQNPATPTMKDQVLTKVVSTMILSVIPMMLPLTIRLIPCLMKRMRPTKSATPCPISQEASSNFSTIQEMNYINHTAL